MVGIICLINAYCYPVRAVRNLRYRIYDQAVILFTVVGGNYIQAIADLKESGQVIIQAIPIYICIIHF